MHNRLIVYLVTLSSLYSSMYFKEVLSRFSTRDESCVCHKTSKLDTCILDCIVTDRIYIHRHQCTYHNIYLDYKVAGMKPSTFKIRLTTGS